MKKGGDGLWIWSCEQKIVHADCDVNWGVFSGREKTGVDRRLPIAVIFEKTGDSGEVDVGSGW